MTFDLPEAGATGFSAPVPRFGRRCFLDPMSVQSPRLVSGQAPRLAKHRRGRVAGVVAYGRPGKPTFFAIAARAKQTMSLKPREKRWSVPQVWKLGQSAKSEHAWVCVLCVGEGCRTGNSLAGSRGERYRQRRWRRALPNSPVPAAWHLRPRAVGVRGARAGTGRGPRRGNERLAGHLLGCPQLGHCRPCST